MKTYWKYHIVNSFTNIKIVHYPLISMASLMSLYQYIKLKIYVRLYLPLVDSMTQYMIFPFLIHQFQYILLRCRLCIRHKIPALVNENYLPSIVLDKLNTQRFTQYTKTFILNNYPSVCNINNCYIYTTTTG